MAGTLSLGVLAAAFQSRYSVCINSDWSEPLCLYTVAVAAPGERKSAVIAALTAPMYEYEAARRESEAAIIAKNQTQRELLEKSLAIAKNTAAKKNSEAARDEAMELSAQLAEFKDIHPYRLLVDDTTPEKLVDIMEAQDGCITVASAEGGVFDSISGRYDKNANFDIYLKGHAGDPITVDRVGRKSNSIREPRLSMILTIQPEVLQGLMGNATFRRRGLCGRFLYAMCSSKIGYRDLNADTIPQTVKDEYSRFVERILEDDGVIQLSEEANRLRLEYSAIVERRLGGEWEHIRDWGGKLIGAMLRIAAMFHASEEAHAADTPISAVRVQSAIEIADFFGTHALAAYQTMGADESHEDAKYLWRRIEKMDSGQFTRRDLFKQCQGKYKRVDAMEPALRTLTEMGYIREDEAVTGGRPSKIIRVNPLTKSPKGTIVA